MKSDLYRKEAYGSKLKGFSNPVSIRGSLSATVMMVGLLALLAGLSAYGWAVPYTRKVSAPGFIAPSTGSINVTSSTEGIAQVMVANGGTVEKGEVLAVVTDTLDDRVGGSLLALQLDGLRDRRHLIDQRITLSERRLEDAERTYTMRIENAQRRGASQRQILAMQQRENELAVVARDRVAELLRRGVNSQAKFNEAESAVLHANQRLIDAEAAAMEAEDNADALRIEREIELNTLQEKLIGSRSERLMLSNEIERMEAERERRVVAPTRGVVTFSKARNFERVMPGEALFTIDPIGDTYVATVLAPSSAIGFVKPDDWISIRYAAYPYGEHGVFKGRVTAIDNTAQLPQAIGAPIGGVEPVYRVYAEVDQSPVNKRGEELRLFSGMVFDASIVADQKPILFWLLDPIF